MSYDFGGLQDAIRAGFGESIASPIFAKLGDPTRASGENIDASGETSIPGTVYIHGRSDGADGVTVVRIKPELDRRVWVFGTPVAVHRENGELVIVGTNTIEANEYFDGVFIDTQNPITLPKIDIGLIQQTQPPSMQCYISPAIYDETYINGKLTADFSASPLDTSATAINVPTTNGKALAVLVQLNVAGDTLEYKQSAEFDVEISLQIAIEQELVPTLDADRERIGWILLRYGVTALRNGVHIYPASSLFAGGGGAAGMTSFTLDADSGTPQTIEDGNTLTITGGTGIETVVGATGAATVGISAGGVGTTQIATGAVTANELATDSVTNIKVANNAIDTAELVDDAVTLAKINNIDTNSGEIVSNGTLLSTRLSNETTTDPTANDDTGDGYVVGSLWINTTDDRMWRCIDNTATAAVWVRIDVEAPEYCRIFHDASVSTVGVAPSTFLSTSQRYTFAEFVSPASSSALGDQFQASVFLAKGTYTFKAMGITSVNGGICKWTLDGVDIITGQDWYSGSTVFNVEQTNGSISVGYSGVHTLTCTVTGQNASSSGFIISLTYYEFYQ